MSGGEGVKVSGLLGMDIDIDSWVPMGARSTWEDAKRAGISELDRCAAFSRRMQADYENVAHWLTAISGNTRKMLDAIEVGDLRQALTINYRIGQCVENAEMRMSSMQSTLIDLIS